MKKTMAAACAALFIVGGAGTASAQSMDSLDTESLGNLGDTDSLGNLGDTDSLGDLGDTESLGDLGDSDSLDSDSLDSDSLDSDSLGTDSLDSDSLGTGSLPGSSTGPAGSVTSFVCGPLGGSVTGSIGLDGIAGLLCGPLGKFAGSLDDNLNLGSITGAIGS